MIGFSPGLNLLRPEVSTGYLWTTGLSPGIEYMPKPPQTDTNAHTHMRVHTWMHTQMHMCTHVMHTFVCTCTYKHTHKHINVHTQHNTNIHTYKHTNTGTSKLPFQIFSHESGTAIQSPSVTKEIVFKLGFWQMWEIKLTFLDGNTLLY